VVAFATLLSTIVVSVESFAQDPAFVFVSRDLSGEPVPEGRTYAFDRAASGRLVIREESGALRTLVDAALGAPVEEHRIDHVDLPSDVADPDLSFDAKRVVFAGLSARDDAWRIYEIGVDGTGLRRVTSNERSFDRERYGDAADALDGHDDLDPCYLPDGRVCFVSTRYPGGAPDGRVRSNNLYVIERDGTGLRRITSEKFGADTPVVEPETGRIVYSRFWRTAPRERSPDDPDDSIEPGSPGYEQVLQDVLTRTIRGLDDDEFPGVNSWFLAAIRPDGGDLRMWSGVGLDREATQAWRPSFLRSGEALALFLPVTPLLGAPRGYGLRRYASGATRPVELGGPQEFARRNGLPPRVDYRYASAEELPDGRLLVSATPGGEFEYGIWVQENELTEPTALYDEAGTQELDAVPLVERELPPVIADEARALATDDAPRNAEEAFAEGGSFTFLCENVHFNAPVDVDMPNAPPVSKDLSIEFWLNSQREAVDGGDAPILLETQRIPPSGRIVAEAPAGVPLFEVLRRRSGQVAVGRDGQIFHVAGSNFGVPGATARCVGCHTGHSMLDVPEDPSFTNLAPSAIVEASSQRRFGRLNLSDFSAVNLVDRRTGSASSEWAAEEGLEEVRVDLRWPVPLAANEIVLWGTSHGEGTIGPREQTVERASVELFSRDASVARIEVDRTLSSTGTSFSVAPDHVFDRVEVVVERSDTNGAYEGREGVALAEIEVVARVAGEPFARFVRGDANCDTLVHLTDAVVILRRLFQGGAALCCRAAADVDEDRNIALTDAVFILNFLFRAGAEPPEPSRVCEPAAWAGIDCATSSCS